MSIIPPYEPVVETDHLSIDLVLYWAEKTLTNTAFVIVVSLGIYAVTSVWKLALLPISVVLYKLCQILNFRYKTRGGALDKNKVILITGGSKGLGREIVANSLKYLNVSKIIVLDKIVPPDLSRKSELVEYYKVDLCDRNLLDKVLEEVLGKYDVNVFVNNAGIRHNERLTSLSTGQIDDILQVNVLSFVQILQKVSSKMAKNVHVVTVASILGMVAPKNVSVYSLSKGALIQVHESASFEIPQFRFSIFLPGKMNTEMFQDTQVPYRFVSATVDLSKLSLRIVDCIKTGERGVFCYPLYTNFIPLLKSLPLCVWELLRRISQMDEQVKEKDDFVLVD